MILHCWRNRFLKVKKFSPKDVRWWRNLTQIYRGERWERWFYQVRHWECLARPVCRWDSWRESCCSCCSRGAPACTGWRGVSPGRHTRDTWGGAARRSSRCCLCCPLSASHPPCPSSPSPAPSAAAWSPPCPPPSRWAARWGPRCPPPREAPRPPPPLRDSAGTLSLSWSGSAPSSWHSPSLLCSGHIWPVLVLTACSPAQLVRCFQHSESGERSVSCHRKTEGEERRGEEGHLPPRLANCIHRLGEMFWTAIKLCQDGRLCWRKLKFYFLQPPGCFNIWLAVSWCWRLSDVRSFVQKSQH